MSLKPAPVGTVPELTCYVARAAFPDGKPYLSVRDALGTFYDDQRFTGLFPDRGRPAQFRSRLALVTVLQFAEGLPDRQVADAVRSRIEWEYARRLELTDPGFDFSVLCVFRSCLLAGDATDPARGTTWSRPAPSKAPTRATS
jgi:transposase